MQPRLLDWSAIGKLAVKEAVIVANIQYAQPLTARTNPTRCALGRNLVFLIGRTSFRTFQSPPRRDKPGSRTFPAVVFLLQRVPLLFQDIMPYSSFGQPIRFCRGGRMCVSPLMASVPHLE